VTGRPGRLGEPGERAAGASVAVVRPAEPEEVAAVGRLTTSVYQAAALGDEQYLEHVGRADDRALRACLLVAEARDCPAFLLGTITLAVAGGDYADIARPGEAELRMLAVAPTVAGRGIGRLLVEACHERAAAAGTRRMVCSVEEQNARALRFYARLGYTRAPDRDWRPIPTVKLLAFTRELDGDLKASETAGEAPIVRSSPATTEARL